MGWLRKLRARIRYRHFEDELREEIETHRAMKERELHAAGASPARAAAASRRAMGNVTLAREDARRVWLAPWLESVAQDLRYAARSLRRSPGYLLTAVLTLGLGLGLNISLFTLFNAVALRAWDVRDPGSVVLPFQRPVGTQGFGNWIPYAEYEYLRERATLTRLLARERGSDRIYRGDGDENDYVQMHGVSWDLFDVLGIPMAAGRGFDASHDQVDAPGVAGVLGYGFARARFGTAEAALGQQLPVGPSRTPVTVVGVVSRSFRGFDLENQTGLYVPLTFLPVVDPDFEPETALERGVSPIGRLRPGADRADAEAELNALDRQFRSAHGLEGNGLQLAGTRPLAQPRQASGLLPMFGAFGAAVLMVLLLSCANVGNLQLARALAREHEVGVRLSLGAGRWRIVRQFLTEAVWVSSAAAGVGLALASVLPHAVLRLSGEETHDMRLAPDLTVVVFAAALALLTTLLFALAPALRTTRAIASAALRVRAGIDRRGRTLRSLLLATQIALSLTLLAGASLLTRGIAQVHSADLGFNSTTTAVASLRLPEELGTRAALDGVHQRLTDLLRDPGSLPAGLLNSVVPLSDSKFAADVRRPDEGEAWDRDARDRPMSSAAFDVLGLEFVSGRPYRDDVDAREVVVNEHLAGLLFPDGPAVGQTVLLRRPVAGAVHEPHIVTGVVRDTFYTTPAAVVPILHRPAAMQRQVYLVFRSDVPDATARIRALVEGVDPRIQLSVAPATAGLDNTLQFRRQAANIAWAIGVLGLTLACIGVFGVFAYAVEERRREIGIRMALGARARDVAGALFRTSRWPVGGGLAAGLIFSVLGGFVLRGYLFGLSPLDPVAYAIVVALLLVAAALATIVPSRRAMRVDPAVTLRTD